MRRRLISEQEESDINLTPMLDVTFIMLIFFIVTATFVKESGIEVRKQQAATAQVKGQASIFVAIDESDNVWVDKRMIDVRSVAANVQRLLAENPKGSVVVQADKESKNGVLVQVLDQIRLAGVPTEKVSLAALQAEM
jgi:biopolymer transport protein ExbD